MSNKEVAPTSEKKFPLTRTEILLPGLFGVAIGLMIAGGAIAVTS